MSDTRSTAQLALDFPVDTTPHLVATIAKVDSLVKQGILNGLGLNQVLQSISTAIQGIAEAFAAPTLGTVGVAGTTTVKYACVPNYPIFVPDSFHSQIMLPGPSPVSRYGSNLMGSPPKERTRRYTPPPAATAIATANAALSGSNYVNVTAPAVVHITSVLFDILKYDTNGNLLGALALGVAPAAVTADQGQALTAYTPPTIYEVGWDTTNSVRVDGPASVMLSRETS